MQISEYSWVNQSATQSNILKFPNDLDETRSIHLIVKSFTFENIVAKGAENVIESAGDATDDVVAKLKDIIESVKKATPTSEDDGKFTLGTGQQNLANNIKRLQGGQTIGLFALPIPNELQDSQSHNWVTDASPVYNTIQNWAENFGKGVGFGAIFRTYTFTAAKEGGRHAQLNPGYFQEYTGSEPRSFTLSWDFSPRSASDAQTITDILFNLKKFTVSKKMMGGALLLSPYCFDIEFGSARLNSLVNMYGVVCTNISIDYGTEQLFPDSMPKVIKLKLEFKERMIISAEDYI